MNKKPVNILDDPRPIKQIFQPEGDAWWAIGKDGVTKIVAYGEPGQGAYVPWFAVYAGDEIISRVNGAFLSDVWYGKAEKTGGNDEQESDLR